VKTEEGCKAVGGRQSGRQVMIFGEVAEAINALYSEIGVGRRVEVNKRKTIRHTSSTPAKT